MTQTERDHIADYLTRFAAEIRNGTYPGLQRVHLIMAHSSSDYPRDPRWSDKSHISTISCNQTQDWHKVSLDLMRGSDDVRDLLYREAGY